MNIKFDDFVYIGMDKTGSAFIREALKQTDLIEPRGYTWFHEVAETVPQIPPEYQHLKVIGSVRNPFSWYVSYWSWYRRDVHRTDWKYCGDLSFEEWVRENPARMVGEFERVYAGSPSYVIRTERVNQDIVDTLRDIRGYVSKEVEKCISEMKVLNSNPERKPYRELYTPELKALVLEGAGPIFNSFYPDRNFPGDS